MSGRAVYQKYVDAGDYSARCSRDERKRRRRKRDRELLHEFVVAPNVRQGLGRLGLVEIRYSPLDGKARFGGLRARRCPSRARFARMRLGVKRLLDLFRTRRAVTHEVMQRYLRGKKDPVARECDHSVA